MSTKTVFKRIALATVSALGLGILSGVPSGATNSSTAAFTTAVSTNVSYLTVVGNTTDTNTAGVFWADVTANESASASQAATVNGLVNTTNTPETMTVTVIAAPTDGAVSDLAIRPVILDSGSSTIGAQGSANDSFTATTASISGSKIATFESSNWTPTATLLNGRLARYAWAVAPVALSGTSTGAHGLGYYTLRVRTETANSRVIDNLVYVKFVSSMADADARITVTGSGAIFQGETLTFQTGRSYTATLSGTNGDRIQRGQNLSAQSKVNLSSFVPPMTADLVTSAGVVLDALQAQDNGVAGSETTGGGDHIAPTTGVTSTSLTNDQLLATYRNVANGVYGITSASPIAGLDTTAKAEALTNRIRVRLTNASAEGLLVVTTGAARTSVTSAQVKIAGTGVAAADTVLTSAITASTTASKAYVLPLTTKSVTVTVDVPTAAHNLTTTTTWSGNFASANVTPASTTALTSATNADGEITRTITNSSPVAGAVATVEVTGFANPANKVTITLTWEAAKVATIDIVEPVSLIHTALKGTTRFSLLVKDQFGNPMANELIQPIVGGSAGVGNFSATTTYATITTDAQGVATWSLTDAAAKADDTDSVSFKSISNSAVTSSSYTITYKTTVAVVGSFLEFFNQDWGNGTPTSTGINSTVPTTGITVANKLSLVYGVNLSDGTLDNYADSETDAAVAIRIRALTAAGLPATGAAVTVTAADGGHIVGVSGNPVSSRTWGVPTSGDITLQAFATKPGLIRFTITSGTATDSFSLDVAAPANTDVRTIAITGAATGTANGEGVPMTVTVKDRYGNSVGGVLLTVAASGVGSFAGGATTQSYTTDATGSYSFLATSLVSAGGTGTFSASIATAGTDASSSAGYVRTTEVDSTLAAGVSSASASVTFAAGQNKAEAAAEAATDAALEAIDAANAATDAANLAAEAADAATVAAEEARDAADAATAAVEALASEVATLIAGLRAQITTLANTVAKIAKRVRA